MIHPLDTTDSPSYAGAGYSDNNRLALFHSNISKTIISRLKIATIANNPIIAAMQLEPGFNKKSYELSICWYFKNKKGSSEINQKNPLNILFEKE
jgi:hypothetical protein